MIENLRMLGRWWKFTRPHKGYFIVSFMSAFLYRICMFIIQPIFAAKVITNLSAGNTKGAILNLIFGLASFLVGFCIIHIKYLVHDKLLRSTYLRFQGMISDKIFMADKVNFKNNSKDRLLNISYQDAWDTANFADTLTNKIGQLGQVIIIFFTIIFSNVLVALIILIMVFVNAFILSLLQTKYAYGTKKIKEGIDNSYHTMSEMLDSAEYLYAESDKKHLKNAHMEANKNMLDRFRARQTWSTAIDNGYGAWCKIFITALTLIMILLVSKGSLSLEMYLIVVPYITTLIDHSNEILAGFKDLKNATVAMNRLKVIENFTPRDIVKFGNDSVDDILGRIDFIDLYYQPKGIKLNTLKDVNFHVQHNETTLILGQKNSGKRSVFGLLVREIEQTKGSIYIDGLDIKDYSNKSYFKNVTYTSSKPYVLNGNIFEQFKAVSKNKIKIKQACIDAGLYDYIMRLPEKFENNVADLAVKEKFLLGLARALLTGASIVAIYELPSLNDEDTQELKSILRKLNGSKTIIIFSAQDTYADISDKIVEIEDGQVKNIQFVEKK
ncbi:MAG: ABC transporter ATP-binding protein [Clostridia bacterium]|nr:ABC transporter ATP-binding protein [Clostridia bacterium]